MNPYVNAGVRLISKPFGETVGRPVVSSIERHIIKNEVASDIERLRRFSGLDFSDWAIGSGKLVRIHSRTGRA